MHENLTLAANGRSACFVVMSANDTDSPERKELFEKENREVDECIHHDLLTDVSDKFQEPIQLAKLNNNRVIRIVMITENALTLFRNSKKRSIN